MKQWFIAIVLAAACVLPTSVFAHEGHTHKVMGTVTAVAGNHLTVKTTDGKTAMVMLDAKTKLTQGKNTVEAASLKVGDRIVAEGMEEKSMLMASTVKVGASQR